MSEEQTLALILDAMHGAIKEHMAVDLRVQSIGNVCEIRLSLSNGTTIIASTSTDEGAHLGDGKAVTP